MKMKRYFAADVRQALREVREEQGPDAVILSNRCVQGGVEIIAAMDYEDALVNASLGNPMAGSGATADSVVSPVQHKEQFAQHDNSASSVDAPLSFERSEQAAANTETNPALGRIQDELKGLRTIMEAPLMQFAWGETGRIKPLYASLLKQLMMLGISPKLSETIAKTIADRGLHKHNWLDALKIDRKSTRLNSSH